MAVFQFNPVFSMSQSDGPLIVYLQVVSALVARGNVAHPLSSRWQSASVVRQVQFIGFGQFPNDFPRFRDKIATASASRCRKAQIHNIGIC